MSNAQTKLHAAIIELLWASLKKDREHSDRVVTGIGTKTKDGLVATVTRLVHDADIEDRIILTPEYWKANPLEVEYTYVEVKGQACWNVSRVEDGMVHLWHENGLGQVGHETCPLVRFEQVYERARTKHERK